MIFSMYREDSSANAPGEQQQRERRRVRSLDDFLTKDISQTTAEWNHLTEFRGRKAKRAASENAILSFPSSSTSPNLFHVETFHQYSVLVDYQAS